MILNLIITDLCFSYVIVSLIGLKEKKNLFLLMFCDNQFKNYSRVYTLSQLSHILKKNCTQYMYELHILIFVCSKVLYWTEGTWTGGRRTNRYFQCIKVKKCYPNMTSRAPSIFSFKSSSFSGNSIIIKMYNYVPIW